MKPIIVQIIILGVAIFDCANAQTANEADDVVDKTFIVVKSPDGDSYFPQGKESYYTRYYRAAKLPSLRDKRERKGHVRFRLGVLPSFTKPLFFTYYKDVTGAYIEIRRLSLRRSVTNSVEPDKVELSGKIKIGKMDSKRLESELKFPEVRQPLKKLTKGERQAYQMCDGCTWVLEVSTDTDYTMSDIGSPASIGNIDAKTLEQLNLPKVDTELFIEFCDLVLKITDMKLSGSGPSEE